MRRLIVILIVLLISVLTGLEISRHPGYLLLVYHSWMVQMPLWAAALTIIFTFIAFYIVMDAIHRLQFLWFRIKNALKFRAEHKAYNKTQHGLELLIEAKWPKAEKLLVSGIEQTVNPLINYLGAAKAAHEQHAWDRRDRYIKQAYQSTPEAEIAIGILQAEFLLAQDQLEQALAILNRLRSLSPKHPRILKLLERAYIRLSDWKQLQLLLPALRKANVLSGTQQLQFEKHLYASIYESEYFKTPELLKQSFASVSRKIRFDGDVVYQYARQLLCFNLQKEASDVICKSLKQAWSGALVTLYGEIPSEDTQQQLALAGSWLKLYGAKSETLFLLGQLCVKAKLWGKAKDYFEKCLKVSPNPKASRAYGQLLLQLGDTDKAIGVFEDGLR